MTKKIFVTAIAAILVAAMFSLFSGDFIISYPAGAPAGYTGSPGDGQNCTGCHLGSASIVSGIITSNIPGSGYVGGTTYNITVTVTGSGVKGFEVSPQDAGGSLMGTLIAGSGSKLVGSGKYITHSVSSTSNPAVWNFQWVAPAAGSGDVTFYGAFADGKPNTILSTLTVIDASIAGPTLSANPNILSGFSYVVGTGPSSPQSLNLLGYNLTGFPDNITLTAPADYELSLDNSSYAASQNVPFTSATLSSTIVYVRLKSGLAINTYNSEQITISGAGAASVNVSCSGSVISAPAPLLTVNPSALSGFTYVVGSGPSASQSYILNGSYLTGAPGNITITGSADYEVSSDDITFTSSINIPYSSATLSSTAVYVRLKSGLSVNSYNSETISHSGGGAGTVNLTCNGNVTDISTTCGSETFENIPATSSSSYLARTWTGDDGNTWNATNARTDQTLTAKAICFKGYVESPVSPNGIGDLTVTTKFPFSDGTFDLPVYVNGVQVGTVPVSSTVTTTTISGINIAGNVQVKFESNGTKRPCIDDLTWTCYDVATNVNELVDQRFDLNVYPNPANDIVNCSVFAPFVTDANLLIYNVFGGVVESKEMNLSEGSSLFSIDVSHLNVGVYYITLISASGNYIESKQLIIK